MRPNSRAFSTRAPKGGDSGGVLCRVRVLTVLSRVPGALHVDGPERRPALRILGCELHGALSGGERLVELIHRRRDAGLPAVHAGILREAAPGARDDLARPPRCGLPEQHGLLDGRLHPGGVEAVGLAEVEGGCLHRAPLLQQPRQLLVHVRVPGLDLQGALELDQRIVDAAFVDVAFGAGDVPGEPLLGRAACQGQQQDHRHAGAP
jgi:hypothetical protein